jgi:hypothetical protein
MIANNELERMWKETVAASFKVLGPEVVYRSGGKTRKSQNSWFFVLRFEPGNFPVRSITDWASLLGTPERVGESTVCA